MTNNGWIKRNMVGEGENKEKTTSTEGEDVL